MLRLGIKKEERLNVKLNLSLWISSWSNQSNLMVGFDIKLYRLQCRKCVVISSTQYKHAASKRVGSFFVLNISHQ